MSDPVVEAAADALHARYCWAGAGDECAGANLHQVVDARAVVAAVRPLIEAEVRAQIAGTECSHRDSIRRFRGMTRYHMKCAACGKSFGDPA